MRKRGMWHAKSCSSCRWMVGRVCRIQTGKVRRKVCSTLLPGTIWLETSNRLITTRAGTTRDHGMWRQSETPTNFHYFHISVIANKLHIILNTWKYFLYCEAVSLISLHLLGTTFFDVRQYITWHYFLYCVSNYLVHLSLLWDNIMPWNYFRYSESTYLALLSLLCGRSSSLLSWCPPREGGNLSLSCLIPSGSIIMGPVLCTTLARSTLWNMTMAHITNCCCKHSLDINK